MQIKKEFTAAAVSLCLHIFTVSSVCAQTPPSTAEVLAYTGLFKAVVMRENDDLKLLIISSKNINARDGLGRTTLHLAAYTANRQAMRLLVEAGANLNLADGRKQSPLTLAKLQGYTRMVEILIAAGAK